jgi:ABC-type spermidine/putrescine transport system permease subunit II
MLRTLPAFLAAPVPGALIQSAVVALWPKPGLGIFDHPLSMFVAICLLVYAAGLVLGVPAAIMLRRRERVGLRAHALAGTGVVLGPVLLALLWALSRESLTPYVAAYSLGYFGLTGLLAGIAFWAIARPDRRFAAR